MTFLIEGSMEGIFDAFSIEGYAWADIFIRRPSKKKDLSKDIDRVSLFASSKDLCNFKRVLKDKNLTDRKHYAQGNLDAGILKTVLGVIPFWESSEAPDQAYMDNYAQVRLAFVTGVGDDALISGLSLTYRKDQPEKWLIGLLEGGNKVPSERRVFLLSSFELSPAHPEDIHIDQTNHPFEQNSLMDRLPPSLQNYLKCAIDQANGQVSPRAGRIELMLLNTNNEGAMEGDYDDFFNDPDLLKDLMASNNVLFDLMAALDLHPSPDCLRACLSGDYSLLKAFEDHPSVYDFSEDPHSLAVLNWLMKLPNPKNYLGEHWDDLSSPNNSFYVAYEPYGFIDLLKDYKRVRKGGTADDFWKRYTQPILEEFVAHPEINKKEVFLITQMMLRKDKILRPLAPWKEAVLATDDYFELFKEGEQKGQAFRLLGTIYDQLEKDFQIKLVPIIPFFVERIRGVDNQAAIFAALEGVDDHTRINGIEIMDRLNHIMVLQDLGVSDELLTLAAEISDSSHRLHQIISQVEKECAALRTRLKHASANDEKLKALSPEIERAYRKAVYEAAYKGLKADDPEVTKRGLAEAEKGIHDAVHMDRHPWLRKALKVIANLVSAICTLGVANALHKSKTGHFLFFDQPKSADEIEQLGKDVAFKVGPSK